MKMTKRQKIDASREARLWISTIIGPVVGAVTTVALTHPESLNKAKELVKNKYGKAKDYVREKMELLKGEKEHKEGL